MRRWSLIVLAGVLLVGFYVSSTLLVRKYWVESFRIPSSGMTPTLLQGDWFLVDKRAFHRREPRLGDVVLFERKGEKFVSRIAGLPGDRVEVRDGELAINGEAVPEEPVDEVVQYRNKSLDVARETLGRASFLVARDPAMEEREIEETVVEPGRYLILGDFRNNAFDSRFGGTIDRDEILGIVTQVYFSLDGAGHVRWNRIGRQVSTP